MATTTTAPRGLSRADYNALLHAIWRLDRELAELPSDSEQRPPLERDREALSALFVRLS
jgi:hypothetical protein